MTNTNAIDRLIFLKDYLSENAGHLIIDGDTHPTDLTILEGELASKYAETDLYYQGRPITPEELLNSMDACGVDMSLIWQNPAAFEYTNDQEENYQRLLKANRYIAEFANAYPKRFIPAGWTDPKSLGLENAKKLASICVDEFGFPIVKMNPAQNAYDINEPMVLETVKHIASLGAAPAFHFGGDTHFTSPSGILKIAETLKNHPLIGVHMGGGGSHYVDGDPTYLEARQIGLKAPNLFFVLSAKRDTHLESDLILYTLKGTPFCNNLNWGSDAPYGLQSWNLAGFKSLLQNLANKNSVTGSLSQVEGNWLNEQTQKGYLGGNLAKLVIKLCEGILVKKNVPIKS